MHRYLRCQGFPFVSAPSSCRLELESTALARLTVGESPITQLGALVRAVSVGGPGNRRWYRSRPRKHHVLMRRLHVVATAFRQDGGVACDTHVTCMAITTLPSGSWPEATGSEAYVPILASAMLIRRMREGVRCGRRSAKDPSFADIYRGKRAHKNMGEPFRAARARPGCARRCPPPGAGFGKPELPGGAAIRIRSPGRRPARPLPARLIDHVNVDRAGDRAGPRAAGRGQGPHRRG